MSRGFTLVELIVFIVVMGFILATVLLPLSTMLQHSNQQQNATVGVELAQGRMDVLVADKINDGFAAIPIGANPCTSPVCTTLPLPPGVTITTNVTSGYEGSTNYKVATVTVNGDAANEITLLLANY